MGKSGKTYFLTITAICIGAFLITGCASKDKKFILSSNVKEDLSDKGDYVYRLMESNNSHYSDPIHEDDIQHVNTNKVAYSINNNQYVDSGKKDNINYGTLQEGNKVKGEGNTKKENSNTKPQNNTDKKVIDKQLSLNENSGDSINIFFERYDDDYTMFALPLEVQVKVDGETVKDYVRWDNIGKCSYSEGRYIYHGVTTQYGKNVNATLTVKKSVYNKIIGVIKNTYVKNGCLYIDVDKAEFYMGEQALQEALKDFNEGKTTAVQRDNDGKYYLPDGYYIRNFSETTTTIKVKDNAQFYLLASELNTSTGNVNLVKVDSNAFKAYMDSNKEQYIRATLCTIYCEGNEATEVIRIFTP